MAENNDKALPFLTRSMLDFDPQALYQLRIKSQSTVAGTLTIRGVSKAGPFTFQHSTAASAAVQTETLGIPDFPILISVLDIAGNFTPGQAHVTLDLLVNGDPIFQLCSGPVFTNKGISFPVGSDLPQRPFGGALRSITGTDRAANTEISETVPDNQVWRLISFNFQLVTDANAANRRVHLNIFDGDFDILNTFANVNHAASTTRNYSCASLPAMLSGTDDDDILMPIPSNFILRPTWKIRTQTVNLQSGDNFGAPQIYVEQFFDPA